MKKGDYFKAIDEFFSVKPHGVRDLELPGGVRCSKSPTSLQIMHTVKSRYLKVEGHPKLLLSQSKFYCSRNF